MINFNELEKFITSGKVVTLVIVVDGEEIGALSFNVDTLAYKEILETVKDKPQVVIADKPKEVKKSEEKKIQKEKITVSIPKGTDLNKINPEPFDDEEEPEEDEDFDENDTDTKADEIEKANEFIKKAEEKKKAENPVVPKESLTREQIMAQSLNEGKATMKDVIETVKPVEEKKPTLFDDEW